MTTDGIPSFPFSRRSRFRTKRQSRVQAKDQTSAVDSKKKEATKKAPAKPVLKGISIKEPIHSTQSNRPITRSRTAETLDKGKGKVVVEKEVPKKTLVTIADSTKAEFLFEDNEQEATQLTRKRKATADPIPDAQVQEKASEFIPKPLPAGVTGFVSGVTSQTAVSSSFYSVGISKSLPSFRLVSGQ